MKRILGISAYYHDSAAALIIDGKVIAAAQEERFTRIKHDPSFPKLAIQFCLKTANCQLEELDAIIFYDKPMLKFERLLETYLAHAPRGFLSFLNAMPIWLKEKLYLKSVLRQELRDLIFARRSEVNATTIGYERKQEKRPKLPQLLFSEHHHSHAASAFYPSPFDKAVVLCLDGVGEWATSSAWLGENASLKPLWEIQFPHSLGLLYSAFTYYCGFKVNSGEYKLMGLAPYGEPKYVEQILEHLVEVNEDGSFALNMTYFDYPAGERMTNAKFDALFGGPAKDADTQITQKEMDLARSIQEVTEKIVLKIAHYAYAQTKCENLCLAGGVALNCVANGRILREGPFKQIWIQPAAGDAGGALGCGLIAYHEYFDEPRKVSPNLDGMSGTYLGPKFDDKDVQSYLQQENISFEQCTDENLFDLIAKKLDQGNVIGWFQGAMEFGPRALGNRSILGDPRNQTMQSVMNLKIKQRESFRPFAPVVLFEDVDDYFDLEVASPYMLLVAQVKKDIRIQQGQSNTFGLDKLNQARSTIPAVTHVDYSARVQTVEQQTNPRLHKLISQFKALTGTSVLINTSFNVRGEPPVCTPADALRCFWATDMDMLVIENCVLYKSQQQQKHIQNAKKITFAKD